MKPEKYEAFYNELLENNIELVTSPKDYELMHIFSFVKSKIKNTYFLRNRQRVPVFLYLFFNYGASNGSFFNAKTGSKPALI